MHRVSTKLITPLLIESAAALNAFVVLRTLTEHPSSAFGAVGYRGAWLKTLAGRFVAMRGVIAD